MGKLKGFWSEHKGLVLAILLAAAGTGWLLLHKLGSLTGGMSAGEARTATAAVGWHGIYHDPFYLPLKLLRSVFFFISPDHGQTLTRLPNAIFGALAVAAFGWLVWLWHGTRTTLLVLLLFATSAWTLHASRLASNDVTYLWAVPTMLLIQVLLHRWGHKAVVWYASLILWGLILYIPGMVWLIILQVYSQRKLLGKVWSAFVSTGHKFLSLFTIVIFVPLLLLNLTRAGQLKEWIGLPAQLPSLAHAGKQFIGVFVHLFVRGPQYPDLWLARAPILDVFTLLCVAVGAYFYAGHRKASRSQTLGLLFIGGYILVALGGSVTLSALVPLAYVAAAAGLAYILQAWLRIFPNNPVARSLGIGLVGVAVILSCAYNLRAYFVAWPHNSTTKAVFQYRR
jgi:hypothetical protein